MWIAVLLGFAPRPSSIFVICYILSGQLLFYATIRSGVAFKRLDESKLAVAHIFFAVTVIALIYWFIPFFRGITFQFLIVMLVFYMQSLDLDQFRLAERVFIGVLSLTQFCVWWWGPQQLTLLTDIATLIISIALLPILSTISKAVRGIQLYRIRQKNELDKTLNRMQVLALHDALTGMFNRRHMTALIESELKRYRRTGRPFSIAMLDIDVFKQINDVHGHAVGDVVLQKLSKIVHGLLRQTDSLARWGGEEFLVLLPETNADEAYMLLDHIRIEVFRHKWSECAQNLSVTFSCGVYESQVEQNIDQSINYADLAMYRAKEEGRNRVSKK